MSQVLTVLESASRRELQALAKELQLCRGNAKSDMIVSHAMRFLDEHPKDGEQRVLGLLGNSPPVAKKVAPKKQEEATAAASVKADAIVKEDVKSDKRQPEDEPESAEVVETKTPEGKKKKTPSNNKSPSVDASKEVKKVTLKDKKKTKQTAPTKATPTAASPAKSPKTSVKASPSTKKAPTSKTPPASVEKKNVAAPVGRKAEIKARKAVETLVKSMTDLTFAGDSRVRCSTTGHEMKADVDVINAYIHGKRYLKARNLKLSFAKYAPMFVDHPDESKTGLLWCNVTESAIARDEESVKKHVAAPKYQNQLPIWKEEEAAKKKAQEEQAQRRAARIEAARKRRLAEGGDGAAESERPAKRKRSAAAKSGK
ncbi:hypothetical protein PHYPSEUDO_010274 [Phytophthora pseudosyringae]|uniref:Uncharacterized protein n=1 Tax=Phytophthora pseudosyringae TaxID=221518 RepID=A0A8T1VBG2_9STRA|nr:hypothetical protein PHYPSEUDO_010274 [Phytophthora pseudosyringae]